MSSFDNTFGINRRNPNKFTMVKRDTTFNNILSGRTVNDAVLKVPRYGNIDLAPNTFLNKADLIFNNENRSMYFNDGTQWIGMLSDTYCVIPMDLNTIGANDVLKSVNIIEKESGNCLIQSEDPRNVLCFLVEPRNQQELELISNVEVYVTGMEDGNCVLVKSDPRDVLCRTVEPRNQQELAKIPDALVYTTGTEDGNCALVKADIKDILCTTVEYKTQEELILLKDSITSYISANQDGNCILVASDPRDVMCVKVDSNSQSELSSLSDLEIYTTGNNGSKCVLVKADPRDVLCETVESREGSSINALQNKQIYITGENILDNGNCILNKANLSEVICRDLDPISLSEINSSLSYEIIGVQNRGFAGCETVVSSMTDAICGTIKSVITDFENTTDFTKVQFLGITETNDDICRTRRFQPQNGSIVYGYQGNGFTELAAPFENSVLTYDYNATPSLRRPQWTPFNFYETVTKTVRFRPDDRLDATQDWFVISYCSWTRIGDMNMLHFSQSSNWQKNDVLTHSGFGSYVSEECMTKIFPGLILPTRVAFTSTSKFPAYPAAPYPDDSSETAFPPSNIVCEYTVEGGFPPPDFDDEPGQCYPNYSNSNETYTVLQSLCETDQDSLGSEIGFAELRVNDNFVLNDNRDSGSVRVFRNVEPTAPHEIIPGVYVWLPDANPEFKSFTLNWVNFDISDATDSITGQSPGDDSDNSKTRPFNPC